MAEVVRRASWPEIIGRCLFTLWLYFLSWGYWDHCLPSLSLPSNQSSFHSSANCKDCLGVAGNFPDKTEKTSNKLEGRANRSYLGFIWSNSILALLPRRREACESSVNPDALVNRLKPADGVGILHFWHQERWAMTGTFKFRFQLPLPRAGWVTVSVVSVADLKKQSWDRMRNRLPVF